MTDREGETTLFTQGASGWESVSEYAASRVELATGKGELDRTTVPTITLDGFCATHGVVPDVLKLDVEGAEARVFAAATRFLSEHRGCLLIEAHPVALEHFGDSLQGLLAILADSGWQTECIYQRGTEDNPDRTLHYIAEHISSPVAAPARADGSR